MTTLPTPAASPTSASAPQDLAGKTAVVTGSTSGIGLEVARHLLARGAKVMLNGLFPDQAATDQFKKTTLLDLQTQFGQRVGFYPANVTKTEEVKALIETTAKVMGDGNKIDILVNNAGIQRVGSVETQSPETFQAVLDTNLTGPRNAMHFAIPYLKAAGGGSIINIGSVHSIVSSNDRSAYCAAKQGLKAVTESIAEELKGTGITTQLICPAFVKTPLAIGPVQDQANRIEQELGVSKEEAYALAEAWRLQHQGGKWIELAELNQLIGDIAAKKTDHASGASVLVGKESELYVGSAKGNIVTFPDSVAWAKAKLAEQEAQPSVVSDVSIVGTFRTGEQTKGIIRG